MDIEKLIEQLRKSADFEDYPIVASFAAIIEKKYSRDAATALSTLHAENEKLRAELERMKGIMRYNGIMVIPSKYPGGRSEWNIPKPRGQKED